MVRSESPFVTLLSHSLVSMHVMVRHILRVFKILTDTLSADLKNFAIPLALFKQ